MTHMARPIQGHALAAVGQGAMGIGGQLRADRTHDEEHVAALRLGISLGLTFLDTAESYGDGHSEELVGRAIRGRRHQVFLASKISPEHLRGGDVVRACEASLTRLGVEHLDLYQIHWPNPLVPLDETLGAMVRLVEQGKVRHIGLSNFPLEDVQAAERLLSGTRLFSIHGEYNLYERGPERDLIPYCADRGMLFIGYSPLDQGRIVGSARLRGVLAEAARQCGRTPGQVALGFLASRWPVLPIPKAIDPAHIRENAESCDAPLPPDVWAYLDRECRMAPLDVGWESIRPIPDATGQHHVYGTLTEALENRMGLCPSPSALAEDIRRDDRIKPIRVVELAAPVGGYRYDLVEGRLRFWAWVIAFSGQRPVPVMVRS